MKKYEKEAEAVFEWFSYEQQNAITITDFDPAYSDLLRVMLARSAEQQQRAATS